MISSRASITRTILAASAIVAWSAGCGQIAERATEEAVERAVESESGENVEIDLDDGELSIESDEGNLTINADDQGVEIAGTDAEGNDFSASADETGLEANSDEAGSLDVDADGSFTATDSEGEVTTGQVEAGGLSVDGEDGESVFDTGEGIPDEWPSDIPEPDGLTEIFHTYVAEGDQESIIITGQADGSAQDTFDSYVDSLTDAGFEETSAANQGDQFQTATFARDDRTVSVTTQSTGAGAEFIVLVD